MSWLLVLMAHVCFASGATQKFFDAAAKLIVLIPQWHRGSDWARSHARRFRDEVSARVQRGAAVCPDERIRLMWIGDGLWEERHGVFRVVDVSRVQRPAIHPPRARRSAARARRRSRQHAHERRVRGARQGRDRWRDREARHAALPASRGRGQGAQPRSPSRAAPIPHAPSAAKRCSASRPNSKRCSRTAAQLGRARSHARCTQHNAPVRAMPLSAACAGPRSHPRSRPRSIENTTRRP